MLSGLPHKVRDAFLLAQLDDLPYRRIGERLSVSERTVKNMAQAFCTALCWKRNSTGCWWSE